jgi:hypothetical protein
MLLPAPLDSMQSNLLVLHHFALWLESVSGNHTERPLLNYADLEALTGSDLPADPAFTDPAVTDHYLVNGQVS